jgi:uncharacterized protein
MLAYDVEWEIIGSTDWSRTFRGKPNVVTDLLRPLGDQFDSPNKVEATRFISDGNIVAVEDEILAERSMGSPIPIATVGSLKCVDAML